jgi:hypothetical protein
MLHPILMSASSHYPSSLAAASGNDRYSLRELLSAKNDTVHSQDLLAHIVETLLEGVEERVDLRVSDTGKGI